MRNPAKAFILAAFFGTAPVAGCSPLLTARPDVTVPTGLRMVRAGHATVWIDMDGFRVLTDPLFGGWLAFFPRNDALGMDPDHLPPVDTVLISHSHMDHYDPESIDRIQTKTPVLFPWAASGPTLGSGAFYRNLVKRHPTYEVQWWKSVTVRNREGKIARITSVPAAHWAGRFALDGLWDHTYGGWVIESGGYTVYFAGDTGMDAAMFREIGRRFPNLDVALLPIGPVLNREGDNRMAGRHINPPQAMESFALLGARQWVPIHYGAFWQSPFHADMPIEWLRELAPADPGGHRLVILETGQVHRIAQNAVFTKQEQFVSPEQDK